MWNSANQLQQISSLSSWFLQLPNNNNNTKKQKKKLKEFFASFSRMFNWKFQGFEIFLQSIKQIFLEHSNKFERRKVMNFLAKNYIKLPKEHKNTWDNIRREHTHHWEKRLVHVTRTLVVFRNQISLADQPESWLTSWNSTGANHNFGWADDFNSGWVNPEKSGSEIQPEF